MLSALLSALLAASPATGLTLSAQLGKATTPPSVYLDAVEQELLAHKVPVRRLQLTCDGNRECLLAGAKAAQLPGLVAVTIAYKKKQATLDLEGLRTSDGTTAAQLTFTVTGRLSDADRAAVRQFSAQLVAALEEKPKDAPVAETPSPLPRLEPVASPDREPAAVTAAQVKPQRSKAPAWILGGTALAAGATAGVFLGLARGAHTELEVNPAQYTRAEAQNSVAEANRNYSIALGAGLAAGALATAAIIALVAE